MGSISVGTLECYDVPKGNDSSGWLVGMQQTADLESTRDEISLLPRMEAMG